MCKKDGKLDEVKNAMVEKILADIESDGAGWVCSWVKAGGPMNPVTGTRYRGRNALLLLFAMESDELTDPRFMTYNQARDAGYQVKKGCHGYPIERWREIWHDVREPEKRIKQPKTSFEREACMANPNLRAKWLPVGHFTVFNARDIDGIPEMDVAAREFAPTGDELIDFLEENAPCEVKEVLQDRAFYSSLADKITMPARGQFASPEAMARVMLHEMCHATGHASRLSRELRNEFGSPEYAREELVAEIGCIFAASALGVGLDDDGSAGESWANHVAYIKSWLEGTGDDAPSEVMRAAARAADACGWLMENCFAGKPGLPAAA